MAHRSQCSSAGDNPLDPNYLPHHYREEYRLAIDALVEDDSGGYYEFLQSADVVDFLSGQEIDYIKHKVQDPLSHQSTQPEVQQQQQQCLGSGDDDVCSSDTYWPVHSDLDAPGLDLGWPEPHCFIGPTEITTLVNPPEPDMPSIKEQARRLIKNAQQLIAVVMDMFTDVDIFADILDAAMRNVVVYILLDEQNVHHFINMVSNCRVNLESIPSMRVRTVSGLTYYCRSGKSFKGQMKDRFLLTDCRAVLSGNYSFMWSFEKIHRCIAHLFLGQLVSTFDEEFRILFAQSQPLIIENALAPTPDFSSLSDRQYSTDRTPLFRDPRKFLPLQSSCPEEWTRQSFEENMDMDRKRVPLRRHEAIHRSLEQDNVETYGNKYSTQQLRRDPCFKEQGYPMVLSNVTGMAVFKRHNYAEDIRGRPSAYQFMQHQAKQNVEGLGIKGRQLQREQHHYQRTETEPDNGGYEKFRGQGYPPTDQYSEPVYPPDMEQLDSYDPVLHYLSSTDAVEMEHGSDKLISPGEGQLGRSRPKRSLSVGQPYYGPPDQEFLIGSSVVCKTQDPDVKQGLRDWRISSYLSAFDDAGEEDLQLPPPIGHDPFDEPLNPLQVKSLDPMPSNSRLSAIELSRIPVPRKDQHPCYIKPNPSEHTPSESSSTTTEGDKIKDFDVKEPKEISITREESFRRKHIPTIPRSSRLRSSLIFSSQLENISQELKNTPGQPDEQTANEEDDQSKLSIVSQILGKQRSVTRKPFDWSSYIKSSDTADNLTTESSKCDDAGGTELPEDPPVDKAMISTGKEQSNHFQVEQTKTIQSVPNQPKPLLSNTSYVDMSDPDSRFMFFKELAAKRKAAKAAEAESSAEKAPIKPGFPLPSFDLKTKATVTEVPHNQEYTSIIKASTSKEASLGTPETSQVPPEIEDEGPPGDSTDAEKIAYKNNLRESRARESSEFLKPSKKPTTSNVTSKDSDLSATSKEFSSHKTTTNNPASTKYSSTELTPSPNESISLNTATKELSPSHPLSPTGAFLSCPTQRGSCSTNSTTREISSDHSKELSASRTPTIKDSSSSNPTSKEQLSSSKPVTFESNIQPLSPPSPPTIPSETSPSPPETSPSPPETSPSPPETSPSPPETSPSPPETSPSPPETSPSPPTIPSETSPSPPETSPSPLTIPTETSPSPPETSPSPPTSPTETSPSPPETSPSPLTIPSETSPSPPETSPSPLETSPSPLTIPSETSPSPPETSTSPPETSPSPPETSPSPPTSPPETSPSPPETSPSPPTSPPETSPSPPTSPTETSPSPPETSPSPPTSPTETSPSPSTSPTETSPSPPETSPSPPTSPTETSPSPPTIPTETSPSPPETSPSPPETSPSPPETSTSPPETSPSPPTSPTETSPSPLTIPTETSPSPPETSPSPPETSPSPPTSPSETSPSPPTSPTETSPSPPTIPTETSPSPPETSPSPPETSPSPLTIPRETSPSPPTSPTETSPFPPTSPSETSPSPPTSPTETSPSPLTIPTETSPFPPSTESSSSLNKTLSESSSFPNPNPTESSASPNLTPILTGSLEPTPMESSPYPYPSPASESSILVENSKEGKSIELNKEQESGSSLASKDQKKKGDAVTMKTVNETTPEELLRCGSQTTDETKVNKNTVTPESTSDQVNPMLLPAKHAKVSQSTANVLSSSNLRDDTKILLEQISANSHNRTELAKESAVTDDAKKDEADRDVRGEGRTPIRRQSTSRPRTNQERDKLLQRMETMRKERKVYSRFEAP